MKDPRVDQWLNKEGVEWHYESEIPLTKVDREASLKNQARFKAIDQDHVIELAIAIEQGNEMPALVGYYSKERRVVIIDGNHRAEAYSLVNKSWSDFYIVDTVHNWVIERLTRMANTKEGPGLTKEERISHAIYLVKVQSMPVESAARSFNLSSGAVQSALEIMDVSNRLGRLGFQERLYPSTLQNLYRIKQDSALLESARLVHEAQLTGEETAELARKVARGHSERAQEAVIADMRHRLRSRIAKTRAGQTRRLILPTIKVRKAVDAINSTRPDSVKPIDKDLFRRLGYAIKRLEEIRQGYEPESG